MTKKIKELRKPRVTFKLLVREMVDAKLQRLQVDAKAREFGFDQTSVAMAAEAKLNLMAAKSRFKDSKNARHGRD